MNKNVFVVIEHVRGQVADISYIMLAAARVIAQETGGEVIALLLGHNARDLAADFAADKVFVIDHPTLAHFTPDAYFDIIAHQIKENAPRAVLLGHTTLGMDVAGGLSVRLNLPLVSQCREFDAVDGALHFISQTCGGKLMAEGVLPEPTALLTVVPGGNKPEQGKSGEVPELVETAVSLPTTPRIKLIQYIEPEAGDVDISKESILIAVGRGLQNQDDLELAEELAEALGGAVCASRPIVDQGWLPTSRLVGKSGQTVKPKLYLALGISGAPEHVESMTGSELIIAVNTDPHAPIFDIAQFGAEVDMLDLLEALNEEMASAKVV